MKVESIFTLEHRNTRIEKMGPDDTRLALDLKFHKSVPLEMLDTLLPTTLSKWLGGAYDKKGQTDYNGLELKPPIKGVEMAVSLKEDVPSAKPLKFKDCKLDKICITITPLKVVDLTFRVIVYPNPEQDGQIGAILGCDVHLSAEGVQGELDLGKKDSKEPKDDPGSDE